MAVATTPGVAWAEDTGEDTSDTSSVDSGPANPEPTTAPEGGSDDTTNPGEAGGGTTITTTTTGTQSTTVIGGGGAPEVTISGSTVDTSGATTQEPSPTGEPTSTPEATPTSAPEPIPTNDPVAPTPPASPTAAPAFSPAAGNADPQPSSDPDAELTNTPMLTTLDNQLDTTLDAPALGSQTMSLTEPDDALNLMAADVAGAVTTVDAPPADLSEAFLAVPGTFITRVLNAVTAFFAPIIGPGAPAENPLLWGLLAWVRRQFNQTEANSFPVLDVQTTSEPEASFPTTAALDAPLAAVTNGPPRISRISVGSPNWSTGVVTGRVYATDADGDPLTYSVDALSAKAAVAVTQASTDGFTRAVLVSDLDQPTDFRFLPDGRILIAEKTGAIRIYENGQLLTQPLMVLPVRTVGESGLNGFAVDPQFQTNGYLYVAYTTKARHERLSRITITGDTADLGSELVLMESSQRSRNYHHGGAVAFGSDGKLYWAVGDNHRRWNAQRPSTIHGKVLRLNPDGTVPSDNPFVSTRGYLPQIYAVGFRNPYRFASAPGGRLLLADVGEVSWEEVNLLTRGANYGWPRQEGPCNGCAYTDPIYAYPHGASAAISSVLVYTGSAFGASYQNKVFIADFMQGWIQVLTCNSDYTSCGGETMFDSQAGNTVQLIQGPDDNIYQLTYTGQLSRIAPISGGGVAS